MKTIIYKIEFFTYWHAGSGLSGGAYADQLVIKDRHNLPFIPGKTLKGLLRDSACRINSFSKQLVDDDFIATVFGQKPTKEQIERESYTKEGSVFFSNATLSAKLTEDVLNEPQAIGNYFYDVVASTKINEAGVAEDHTLRQLEVTIPLTLYAAIENFPEGNENMEKLAHCLGGVKRMGLNRSRGLGRCYFSILNG